MAGAEGFNSIAPGQIEPQLPHYYLALNVWVPNRIRFGHMEQKGGLVVSGCTDSLSFRRLFLRWDGTTAGSQNISAIAPRFRSLAGHQSEIAGFQSYPFQ